MKVKQRDIILIKFPFSDLSGAKVRPALVISNDKYNSSKLDAVVVAMTSNISLSEYKKVLKIQGKLNQAKFEEIKNTISKLVQ
ncbi:MAG: type II toxin-antitoxin system PemK/MazF family toxin [Xenococcaceae cyanobacterium MO_207.B15]|nr:type II toxin-antitoxin system PemK/MazF family toxin [Xenococcaceae cyanobacterium MO_207.B15]